MGELAAWSTAPEGRKQSPDQSCSPAWGEKGRGQRAGCPACGERAVTAAFPSITARQRCLAVSNTEEMAVAF